MQVITSKDNDIVKNIKKLKDKKYRDEQSSYIIEGLKIISEAIEENAVIKKVVICEDYITNDTINSKVMYEIARHECIYVSKKVFDSITTVIAPQGILAVVEKPNVHKNINYKEDVILILDGIQDPGNLGTILRTADSVDLKQIIVSKETADVYNPKVVRSTMGAIFRVNVIESSNLVETIKEIKKNRFKIIATSLGGTDTIYDIEYKKKAIIIGNESKGVSKEVLEAADSTVVIPMLGKTESLNASVACGIILYEYARRNRNLKK